MSGSNTTSPVPGTALSALPVLGTAPAQTDMVFGVFNGVGQFVPQSQVWAGAVPLAGNATITGALSVQAPTQPDHPATKAYVDNLGGAIVTSVQGAVSASATAAQTAQQKAAISESNALAYATGASNAAITALNGQRGAANGVAAISADGNLLLSGTEIIGLSDGHVTIVLPLATTDPHIVGALWNNGGYVAVSAG